jgi:hypothetical protein
MYAKSDSEQSGTRTTSCSTNRGRRQGIEAAMGAGVRAAAGLEEVPAWGKTGRDLGDHPTNMFTGPLIMRASNFAVAPRRPGTDLLSRAGLANWPTQKQRSCADLLIRSMIRPYAGGIYAASAIGPAEGMTQERLRKGGG